MRIALLSPLPPEQTGIADYASIFMQYLQEAGVDVVCPLAGISLEQLPSALKLIDWTAFDVVHAEFGGGRFIEFSAMQWLSNLSVRPKLTATVHDPERLVWRLAQLPKLLSWCTATTITAKLAAVLVDPWTLQTERNLAHKMDMLITLTHTGAKCLQHKMRIDESKIHVIAHGNQKVDHAALPELKPVRLLYFGFIYRGKGIEDLLDALALVFAKKPELKCDIKLTLAGGTAPDTVFNSKDNYYEQLLLKVNALNLAEVVDWQLNLPKESIVKLMQAHHVLVLPYQESRKLALLGQMRGTSGVLSWANACGRGVITSDARSFSEEVSYGNGLIYRQGNIAELAQHIIDIVDDPQKIRSWHTAAYQLGVERAWTSVAQQFISNVFSRV